MNFADESDHAAAGVHTAIGLGDTGWIAAWRAGSGGGELGW